MDGQMDGLVGKMKNGVKEEGEECGQTDRTLDD